jgi:hypothetical protein
MQTLDRTPCANVQALVRSDDAAGLCKKINVCIEKAQTAVKKAEQFYTTAALHIQTLQEQFPQTWHLLLKEHCGFGRSRAYEIRAIAEGRKSEEQVRNGNAERQRIFRERTKQPESVTSRTPEPAVVSDAEQVEIQEHIVADEPVTEPPEADAWLEDMERERLEQHVRDMGISASQALSGAKAAAKLLKRCPNLKDAGLAACAELAAATWAKIAKAAEPLDANQMEVFDPNDAVEDPAIVLTNVLDSIEQSRGVAEAFRKIFKVSTFDRAAKKEICDAIESLIRKWRSVQATLAALKKLATEGE